MHANRNKKAVKRVEKGMMKANRIRNLFAVFAIVLTTFMITTVFSLGINYMENMKLMQVRTAGTTANASLAMPTEKQEQQIKNLEYVKTVGTQYMVGSVAEKNDEGRDLSIALSYYDPTPTTFDALLYNSTLTLYVLDASSQSFISFATVR